MNIATKIQPSLLGRMAHLEKGCQVAIEVGGEFVLAGKRYKTFSITVPNLVDRHGNVMHLPPRLVLVEAEVLETHTDPLLQAPGVSAFGLYTLACRKQRGVIEWLWPDFAHRLPRARERLGERAGSQGLVRSSVTATAAAGRQIDSIPLAVRVWTFPLEAQMNGVGRTIRGIAHVVGADIADGLVSGWPRRAKGRLDARTTAIAGHGEKPWRERSS
jgi:hypothetical protein